ncbi:MAG: non-ribosomal peptide synthetase, partial [Bacteroidetes bacterium]
MITKENIKYFYGLSPLQEGMLYHYLLDEQTTANVHQLSYTVRGPLNPTLFEESWNRILSRHDMLRTNFIYKKVKKPIQLVLKERKVEFHQEDISQLSETEQEHYLNQFREQDKKRGFDPGKDVLLRIAVIRLSEEQHLVIWTYHHLILDGWCMGIVMGELIQIYEQLLKGSSPELQDAISYGEYIKYLSKIPPSKSRQYWKNYLNHYEVCESFPKKKNDAKESYRYANHRFEISEQLLKQLQEFSQSCNATLNATLQSAWGILLGKYNNNQDAVFGYTVSGRNPEIQGVEEIIGLFINTIPVRIHFQESERVRELVTRTHEEAVEAQAFHHSSLAEIQSVSGAGSKLIDHIVVFENFPVNEKIEEESKGVIEIEGVEIFEHTTYDLALTFLPGKSLRIRIEYNALVFDSQIIERIASQFTQIVSAICENQEVRINEIELISPSEREFLLQEYNRTESNYPKESGLAVLFEQQVLAHPDKLALRFGAAEFTYAELNQRANQLANYLEQLKDVSDRPVAILLRRSPELYVAILAVLKLGAPYLPL